MGHGRRGGQLARCRRGHSPRRRRGEPCGGGIQCSGKRDIPSPPRTEACSPPLPSAASRSPGRRCTPSSGFATPGFTTARQTAGSTSSMARLPTTVISPIQRSTIGMTFQVSDTDLVGKRVRRVRAPPRAVVVRVRHGDRGHHGQLGRRPARALGLNDSHAETRSTRSVKWLGVGEERSRQLSERPFGGCARLRPPRDGPRSGRRPAARCRRRGWRRRQAVPTHDLRDLRQVRRAPGSRRQDLVDLTEVVRRHDAGAGYRQELGVFGRRGCRTRGPRREVCRRPRRGEVERGPSTVQVVVPSSP